jgi:protein-S-isoprenylcysteine O-methyltransferase Ste14
MAFMHKNLILQAIAGFAFLMVVMALAIFVPAGTMQYWQGWLYLATFAVSTILITIYLAMYDQELLAGRVKAGVTAEPTRTQQVIQALAGLCFILIFVTAGLDFRFGWSSIAPIGSVIADVLVAVGFGIVFLVFRENSYTRSTVEVSAGQTVVSSGPYAVVRHPMYAGAGILVLATPIALGSWIALAFAVLLMLAISVRLQDEEKLLSAELSGYEAYRQTVRYRLIPGIW